MEIIAFIIGLFFVFYPVLFKSKKETFVDYFIVFCLFFDLSNVFFDIQNLSFVFSQDLIVLIYVIYYLWINFSSISKITRRVFYLSLLFIIINFFIPLFYGETFKNNIISTTQISSSFLILPLAFHHYATRGDIFNLVKKAWVFIVFLILGILFFTIFKIDSNYITESGDLFSSVASQSGWLYFGNFDIRGGFTYISFLILLFPLFFIYKIKSKFKIYLALSFLFLLVILSFKRMALSIIFTGTIIWFFSGYLKQFNKIKVVFTSSLLILVGILFFGLEQKVMERINIRGGNEHIGIETFKNDIRLFEFYYIFQNLDSQNLIFGYTSENTYDIRNDDFDMLDWSIHNQYAQYLLKIGLIGVINYLVLLLYLFNYTRKSYNIISSNNFHLKYNQALWITFKTLMITFLLAGMVGGLDKVTVRGIVFIFLGAIAGHFYKNVNFLNNKLIKKAS